MLRLCGNYKHLPGKFLFSLNMVGLILHYCSVMFGVLLYCEVMPCCITVMDLDILSKSIMFSKAFIFFFLFFGLTSSCELCSL